MIKLKLREDRNKDQKNKQLSATNFTQTRAALDLWSYCTARGSTFGCSSTVTGWLAQRLKAETHMAITLVEVAEVTDDIMDVLLVVDITEQSHTLSAQLKTHLIVISQ